MPDDVREIWNFGLPGETQPRAQVIPEPYAQFEACFCQAEERVAAVSPDIASGPTANLALRDLAANVIFRAVGVKGNFRPFEHQQQFGLIGMEALKQSVEGDEAGLLREDAIKPRRQGRLASFAGGEPIGLEIAVQSPDQPADFALGAAVLIGEGIELMD